jgi:mRNA-degrading endonuclease RelE of RelBE toxin-antitoxin system
MATAGLPNIEISRRAMRDLRKLASGDVRRVRGGLEALSAGAANLDVKAVANRAPWLRLRMGELRVLYRPLNEDELDQDAEKWLISRGVHRRELDRAIASLGP